SHPATSGGKPIGCAAALATIETSEADGLVARADKLGAAFRQRLESLKARCPSIQEFRIKGAMIGIELSLDGAPIVQRCLERRLLVNCTHGTVIRLLPALNLEDSQLDEGCGILEEVLLTYKSND